MLNIISVSQPKLLRKSLIVSIITSVGISGIGDKKHVSETIVLWQKPVIIVLAYNGIAFPNFIGSSFTSTYDTGSLLRVLYIYRVPAMGWALGWHNVDTVMVS